MSAHISLDFNERLEVKILSSRLAKHFISIEFNKSNE